MCWARCVHSSFVPVDDICSAARPSLFDHLVGSYLQSQWDCKPKCFGGFEVYNEFKLGRLQDRQISRLFALENPAGVDPSLPPSVRKVRSIAHKATDRHGWAPGVHLW